LKSSHTEWYGNTGGDTVKPSRMAIYSIIALLAAGTAFWLLAQKPSPGWPINLIYLLLKR